MKTKYIVQFVFGLVVLILGNGCVTKHLWESNAFDAWNQPAANSNLRLYQAKSKNDLLVVYDEYSERHDSTHSRAYWLNENQKLIEDRHTPHFVSTHYLDHLSALPIFSASVDSSRSLPPFVITAANGQSFTLYSERGTCATHSLPFYKDRQGKVEKIVLTPLANTADLTIVGGAVGLLYLECRYGQGGNIIIPYYPSN